MRVLFSEQNGVERYNCRCERIILIGANPFASAFIQLLSAYTPQRQPVIAVLDENATMIGRALAGVQVLGTPDELDTIIGEFAIHGIDTDRVVVVGEIDTFSPTVLHEVERTCQRRKINLCFLPRMLGVTEGQPSREAVGSPTTQPSFSPSSFYPR